MPAETGPNGTASATKYLHELSVLSVFAAGETLFAEGEQGKSRRPPRSALRGRRGRAVLSQISQQSTRMWRRGSQASNTKGEVPHGPRVGQSDDAE